MAKLSIAILACVILVGCTDASYQRNISSIGAKHRITMYSGGKSVGVWVSTGQPSSVASEDGWTFVDATTKKLITVTGDVVIELMD